MYSLNILLDSNGRGRIGDFGFSWELPDVDVSRSVFTSRGFAFSKGYTAHELTYGRCSTKSDVYSYGIVRNQWFCSSNRSYIIIIIIVGYTRDIQWLKGLLYWSSWLFAGNNNYYNIIDLANWYEFSFMFLTCSRITYKMLSYQLRSLNFRVTRVLVNAQRVCLE